MKSWRLAKWMAGAIGLLMVISCVGGLFEPAVVAVLYVCFGWIGFLRHIRPHVTVNSEGVATAAGCLIAVAAGAQWFLNWLWTNAPRVDNIDRLAWQPRWTAAFIASVVLMFASGLCVVGAAHQTAWLATSEQPVIESTFETFYREESQKNLKQIGAAASDYAKANSALPAAATFDEHGRPLHSWQTRLLPFIGYQRLYDEIDHALPWHARENRAVFAQQVMPYVRLKDWSRGGFEYAITSYAGNAWLLGGSRRWKPDEITDGTSNTILCGEAATEPRAWGDPANWRDPAEGLAHRPTSFGGAFHGFTLFNFADGHVTPVSNRIDPAVFRALCTPAAGDKIRETDDAKDDTSRGPE